MKILIVEDNIDLVEFLKRGLEGEGFDVAYAIKGKEALRWLGKNKADLIILDLLLPDLDGEQVMKRLKQKKNDTPILILTAVNRLDRRIKLFNLGANDYLCKPFSFVELVTKIQVILNRSNNLEIENEIIEISDLRIDVRSRKVLQRGQEIKFRYKEFELLLYLARNANRVISREVLLKNVWQYNTMLFTNTVDSHISIIRNKIDRENKTRLIETIYGAGYVLKNEQV